MASAFGIVGAIIGNPLASLALVLALLAGTYGYFAYESPDAKRERLRSARKEKKSEGLQVGLKP